MQKGKFISIEGVEGAGKSTAISFLKKCLENSKFKIFWTREPGGTPIAEDIRQLLLHNKHQELMTAEAELLLMFAARAQHMQVIRRELAQGHWVIADRFIDATYAYQGNGRNLSDDHILYLENWIVHDDLPDVTLLMDIPPEIGMQRAHNRGNAKDRIEQEKIDFFIRVRNGYLKRAQACPDRIKIIDASLPLTQVESQIKIIVDNFIQRQP